MDPALIDCAKNVINNLGYKNIFVSSARKAESVFKSNIIVAITNNYEVPVLKQVVDAISNKVSNSFVLLANVGDNKVNFIGKCTINNDNINVGSIIKELSLMEMDILKSGKKKQKEEDFQIVKIQLKLWNTC